MADQPLTRVAFVMGPGFEDSEFTVPYQGLKQAGAQITLLAPYMGESYQGKRGDANADPDATFSEVLSEDFDAFVIPGGNAPDQIRANPHVQRLMIDAMAQEKLVAAVCHGPQILIEADQLRGKQATGYRAIRKDLQNAGVTYVDEPVVTDGNLITSRQPSDLPLFTTMILSRLGLSLQDMQMPNTADQTFEWWKLAQGWGGSSREGILIALNRALVGERYSVAAFQAYESKANDSELRVVLRETIATKERNALVIESRLTDFNEPATWQTWSSETFATLQSWLQANDDDGVLMRRALGDLQTGIKGSHQLCVGVTDPRTGELLNQIEAALMVHEQRLSDLYRARLGSQVQPPIPTGTLI